MVRAAPPPPDPPPVESIYIFAVIAVVITTLVAIQRPAPKNRVGHWLPPESSKKHQYEVWVVFYSLVWMGAFGAIITYGWYEQYTAAAYFYVCGGLALPLVLQPFVAHWQGWRGAQHSLRAQVWVAIFGFIGNYWYTHYFYSVLRAKYTMPSWRLNDVPIAMYLATHFYFSTYHVLGSMPLRYVSTAYAATRARTALTVALVLAMAYSIAFMETLTISHFPYYSFEDRASAYTVLRRAALRGRDNQLLPGPEPNPAHPPAHPPRSAQVGSAFYGIYFIVSFPMYFAMDEPFASLPSPGNSLVEVATSALGSAMAVLMGLDLVRLAVGVPLQIGGKLVEVTG